MTKVIMHGCNGKMGQVITGLIAQDGDVEIVAGIDTVSGIASSCAFVAAALILSI